MRPPVFRPARHSLARLACHRRGASAWEYALGTGLVALLVFLPVAADNLQAGIDALLGAEGLMGEELGESTQFGAGTVVGLDFSQPDHATDNWRDFNGQPNSFATFNLAGEFVLRLNIDETGPTSGVNSFQGQEQIGPGNPPTAPYLNLPDGSNVSLDLYIPPGWEGDGDSQTPGIRILGGAEDGSQTVEPRLVYRDSDADGSNATFRVFTTTSGWTDVGLPAGFDPATGGWVEVSYELDEGTAHRWTVNGEELIADSGAQSDGTTRIQTFVLEARNFGLDEDYFYDNVAATAGAVAGSS